MQLMHMVQMNERVSIIMAAYNAEKTIRCAIDSVIAQTYTNFELLVIDDCSSDNTRSIVEEYSNRDNRVKLLANSRNMGVSLTRMNGLKASVGSWIAVLDSDDAWLPEKLEKQMQLQHQTKAALLYTGSAFMDESGKAMEWIMHVPTRVNYRKLLKQNILSNSSSLCRKDLFEKYYCTCDGVHEDFVLWLNILKQGEIAYGIDEPLLRYRVSSNSKTGNKFKSAKMNWKTYREVGLSRAVSLYYMIWYVVRSVIKYRYIALFRSI